MDSRDETVLEGDFEKKKWKIQIGIFWNYNNVLIQRKGHKIILYHNSHGIWLRFFSPREDVKHIFRWFKGLSEVNIEKKYFFGKLQSQETESYIF